MVQFDDEKQKVALDALREHDEEEFLSKAAQNRGIQYVNLAQSAVDLDALRLVSETDARKAGVVAFQMMDKKIDVAVLNPDENATKIILDSLSAQGFIISLFLVSHKSLGRVLERYKELSASVATKTGSFEILDDQIETVLQKIKTTKDIQKEISDVTQVQGVSTTRVLEVLLGGALAIKASDIHIEPAENTIRLRFRLDGLLNEIMEIPRELYNYLLSRIKLISGLHLNVKDKAQDGHFSIHAKKSEIEIRTSTLPGTYGESIVLCVLDPDMISITMEQLGLEPHLQEILEHTITKPNGLLLTTGPTGSGKTTTLYAFLRKVYTDKIKIITIEDPVEYHLDGIVQTQINPARGYSFTEGLRSALRQDPDIIMVGEIRDNEAADIAINAALTGHLVFSTLHTNNAAGTFPRLLSFGVNPKVLSSSVTVAMAQRLVRKLCDQCKKQIPLSPADRKIVDTVMRSVSQTEYISLPREKIYTAVGCDKCNGTGYRGRIGIFEAIVMDKGIEKAVLNNPSEREIQEAARNQKLLNMQQDGVVKILKGITSIDELSRVIDLQAEV